MLVLNAHEVFLYFSYSSYSSSSKTNKPCLVNRNMNADSKEELVPVLKSTPQADARNRLRSTLSSGACHLGVEFRIKIRQITNKYAIE